LKLSSLLKQTGKYFLLSNSSLLIALSVKKRYKINHLFTNTYLFWGDCLVGGWFGMVFAH
tara:strand:+ start:131 stop:310 length:180 start_codon:yes stop_codon:yes gene_type:complete